MSSTSCSPSLMVYKYNTFVHNLTTDMSHLTDTRLDKGDCEELSAAVALRSCCKLSEAHSQH
jgi:hypothetical protein